MIPAIRDHPYPLLITVGVVLILIYGNLRGLKEAGSYFALPTYFYIVMMTSMIVFGFYKKIAGSLHRIPLPLQHDLIGHHLGSKGTGILMGLAFLSLLRAYAQGGSSLTGLEAISNGARDSLQYRYPPITATRTNNEVPPIRRSVRSRRPSRRISSFAPRNSA